MADPLPSPPGACYKFTVKSAEEAAALIRERLGPGARVLTVRTVEASGLARLWSGPRLEVVAQMDAVAAQPAGPAEISGQPAEPSSSQAKFPELRSGRSTTASSGFKPAALPSFLRRSGLSEVVIARLQGLPQWSELTAAPLHRALAEVGRHLQCESEGRRGAAPLTRAAFLGTPGTGRTTALCKWLGLEVFRRARLGHVITAEFDRPNLPGALPVFCEALGIPVAHYPASTQPAVPGGFVYFDLPGLSLRDPSENASIAQFLERERIEERVLVLNASCDHSVLRAAYAAGRSLGATHLAFTHLDEVQHWGRLWDYLLDSALEPLFLATGPSLTGDCEEDVFGALVRRTLAAGGPPASNPDEGGESDGDQTLLSADLPEAAALP